MVRNLLHDDNVRTVYGQEERVRREIGTTFAALDRAIDAHITAAQIAA
jgi:hypothetical protein